MVCRCITLSNGSHERETLYNSVWNLGKAATESYEMLKTAFRDVQNAFCSEQQQFISFKAHFRWLKLKVGNEESLSGSSV